MRRPANAPHIFTYTLRHFLAQHSFLSLGKERRRCKEIIIIPTDTRGNASHGQLQQGESLDHDSHAGILGISKFIQRSFESLLCNQLMSMQQNQVQSMKPNRYDKISLEKRIRLASLVLEESLSIAKSAKKVGIKLSTAKLIMKKYREEGTFFESRKDKKDRLQNRETQLEEPIEHSPSMLQNDQEEVKLAPQAVMPCYFMALTQGMFLFPQACLAFMPNYQ